jgi:hypothetical protein
MNLPSRSTVSAGLAGDARKRARTKARLAAREGARVEAPAAAAPAGARIAVGFLPPEALTPNARNARVHSARQVARIADSIRAFGFNAPLLIDAEGGVLAGHGRLAAARRLGLKEVPTIRLDHLTEAQRRAFMIADNRLGELASWDTNRLAVELRELKDLDLDFALPATGFELKEIELRIGAADAGEGRSPSPDGLSGAGGSLAGDVIAPQGGADDRASQAPVSRPGDTWALGPHRLACALAPGEAFFALDAAIRRWQAASGDKARLHPGGPEFDAVARQRLPFSGRRDG